MKIIVCVDLKNGMLFNNRRQSKDRFLIKYIKELIGENKLWITEFSKDIFENTKYNLFDFKKLDSIGQDDFLFIENFSPKLLEENLEEIILFNWNRNYPADLFFDITLKDWQLKREIEIKGSSHEKISGKIYKRKGE